MFRPLCYTTTFFDLTIEKLAMTFTETTSHTTTLSASAANISRPQVAAPTLPTTPISNSSTHQPISDKPPSSGEDTSLHQINLSASASIRKGTRPSTLVTNASDSSPLLASVSQLNSLPTVHRQQRTRPTADTSTFVSKTSVQNKTSLVEETEEQKREAAVHVTIWNRAECRKIAGNAAPLRRNLARYLQRHPECEEYVDQDKQPNFVNSADNVDPTTGLVRPQQNDHVPIWNRLEQRKVTGNAAPLRKNLEAYLAKHPEYEVYAGQDKEPTTRAPWPPPATSPLPSDSSLLPDTPITNTPTTHTSSVASRNTVHFVNSQGRIVAFGPPKSLIAQSVKAAAQNHDEDWIVTPSVDAGAGELTYGELASSWSHNPAWIGPSSPPGSHPSFSPAPSPPTDMDCIGSSSGIPIPYRSTDITMATSSGTPYGVAAALDVPFLAYSPPSMDLDADDVQFSPSKYLRTDVNMSGAGCSPPLHFPSDSYNSLTHFSPPR